MDAIFIQAMAAMLEDVGGQYTMLADSFDKSKGKSVAIRKAPSGVIQVKSFDDSHEAQEWASVLEPPR